MKNRVFKKLFLIISLVLFIFGCSTETKLNYLYVYTKYISGYVGDVGSLDMDYSVQGDAASVIKLESSDSSIVKVSGICDYELVGIGSANINVYGDGELYASIPVYVSIDIVVIGKIYDSVGAVGEAVECTGDIKSNITLTSSDESVVKVSGTSYELVGEGSAYINVFYNSQLFQTISVEVYDSYLYSVSDITLFPELITIGKNQKYTIEYSLWPSYAYATDIKWTSSDTSIATVSRDGVITGVSAGTTTITGTSKAYSYIYDSVEVTVSNDEFVPIEKISLSQTSLSLVRGGKEAITATISPTTATNTQLTWSVSDSGVVYVVYSEESNSFTIDAIGVGSTELKVYSLDGSVEATCQIKVSVPASASANQFFWGTWVDMSNGKEYEVEENSFEDKNNFKSYRIIDGSDEKLLKVESFGNFEYQSDSVIIKKPVNGTDEGPIPYFRKGGTDLKYQLRLVGFEDTVSRAAASSSVNGKSGLKAKGTSKRFSSYDSEGESDTEGYVQLRAPVQGDVQNVSIETDSGYTITINDLKIENDGNFMGTVPIVEEDKYNLKVTGVIDQDQKDDGYLYANNSYYMNLAITNISSVRAETSILRVYSEDDFIELTSTDDIENGVTISTLKQNGTKNVGININVGSLNKPYVDTRIKIEITNAITGQKWIDEVPLRIFKKKASFVFKCSSPENNLSASLNGFIIYPDKNCMYFSVPAEQSGVVEVPLFGDSDEYILAFSGAVVTSNLEESTELYYTVAIDSEVEREFTYNKLGVAEKVKIIGFGEQGSIGNEKETTAFPVSNDFEAYLKEGDIDFYKVNILSNKAGISIEDEIVLFEDIEITYDFELNTFTADSGYSSYKWFVDNVEQTGEKTNVFVISADSLSEGVTEVSVLAEDADGVYRYKSISINQ